MSTASELLRRGRDLLQAARLDRDAWQQLRVRVSQRDDGAEDEALADRMQLVWALQYDARVEDAELIRFTLTEEVKWRCVAPWQEIGEALEILGWLVARDRDVLDVGLLAQAKTANFDTACGFDREHLFAAGVELTLAHVRNAQPELLAALVTDAGEPVCAQDEVDRWLARRSRNFVSDPDHEPATVWIDRALFLGDRELARRLVHAWSAGLPRNADTLGLIVSYCNAVGDHRAEADARAQRVGLQNDPFDIAGELQRLADAERLAGRSDRALAALTRASGMHRSQPTWRELGLGRFLVQSCFELAEASEPEIARAAFVLADELGSVTPRLPPAALEIGVQVAERLGLRDRARHYREQLAQMRTSS